MNIDDINKEINRLQQENSYEACQKLASLYIVKDHLHPSIQDETEKQLMDILPSYNKYVCTKRNYQLGNAGEKAVEMTLNNLCQEVFEFVVSLYSSTSTPEERCYLQELSDKIKNFIKI